MSGVTVAFKSVDLREVLPMPQVTSTQDQPQTAITGRLISLSGRLFRHLFGDLPDSNEPTKSQIEARLALAIVVLRSLEVGYPLYAFVASWHRYIHPVLGGVAMAVAIASCIRLLIVTKRKRSLNRSVVAQEVFVSVAVVVATMYAVGPKEEFAISTQLITYLLGAAALAGGTFRFSKWGILVAIACGIAWDLSVPAPTFVMVSSAGAFAFWYLVTAGMVTSLIDLATRLDAALADAQRQREKVQKQRESEERTWTHRVAGILQRVASSQTTDHDRNLASLEVNQTRVKRLNDHRYQLDSCATGLLELTDIAHNHGLRLELDPVLAGEPCDPDVTSAVFELLDLLVGNIATHAEVDLAELRFRCQANELVATLADKGCGFDTDVTERNSRWSPVTKAARETLSELGGTSEVSSGAEGTVGRIAWSWK